MGRIDRKKYIGRGMLHVWKTTVNTITGIIFCVFVILWLLRCLGYEPYRILTGSMEPTLIEGEIVWIDTNAYDAKEGDVIAFCVGENVVIHRVIKIKPEGDYITKGDANITEDFDAVDQEDVIGILWMKLGFFTWFWDLFYTRENWAVIVCLILINIFTEVLADKNLGEEVEYA